MNYLAHLYLAEQTAEGLLGNLLGDFVGKAEEQDFSEEIRRGITLHRKIDSFTDRHPIFWQSKRRVSFEYQRYAGVIIDMFYDHFLAKNWAEYSKESLEEFVQRFYQILEKYEVILPERLQLVKPVMIRENWLLSYREVVGISNALERIFKRRLPEIKLSFDAQVELLQNYEEYQRDFRLFFPEVRKFSSFFLEI